MPRDSAVCLGDNRGTPWPRADRSALFGRNAPPLVSARRVISSYPKQVLFLVRSRFQWDGTMEGAATRISHFEDRLIREEERARVFLVAILACKVRSHQVVPSQSISGVRAFPDGSPPARAASLCKPAQPRHKRDAALRFADPPEPPTGFAEAEFEAFPPPVTIEVSARNTSTLLFS